MFLGIYTFALSICLFMHYMIKPDKLQNKDDFSTNYHWMINLLNVGIQDVLIRYFVLENQVTKNNTKITFLNTIITPYLFLLIQDLYFYIFHRMVHHELIYKYIHKMHHEIKNPNIFTSFYDNPIEQIILWILPYILYPRIVDINIYAYIFILFYTTILALEGHSGNSYNEKIWYNGYVFTNKKIPKYAIYISHHTYGHDMHHEYTNCNYALYFTHLDRYFGTLHKNFDKIANELYNKK